jgi:putative transposase
VENLALRQQLATLKRMHPRPKLALFDRLFWVLARRFWPEWKQALLIVSPETVVRWHRSGFALYWRAISKAVLRKNSMGATGSHIFKASTFLNL